MRYPLETHLHDPPRRTARCGSRAALAVLLMLGGCSGASGPEEAPAPDCESVIVRYPGDVGQVGDVEHVHDPAIVRHGDTYYVYSTNDGIPIRRSRDLVRWERVGRVFEAQLPPWARSEVPGAEAPWAPEIAYFHGRFHLYYSLSTFGSQRSVIGMATNVTLDPEHPDYRWTGQGRVLESRTGASRYNAIDPDVVLDSDGLPWLSWGSHWGGLYLRRLDAAGSGPGPAGRPTGALPRRGHVGFPIALAADDVAADEHHRPHPGGDGLGVRGRALARGTVAGREGGARLSDHESVTADLVTRRGVTRLPFPSSEPASGARCTGAYRARRVSR